jgi:selenoprotein W-related protein
MERGAVEVELVKGVAGVFEITIDGKLVFSKKQLGRFPEDAEIDALAGG